MSCSAHIVVDRDFADFCASRKFPLITIDLQFSARFGFSNGPRSIRCVVTGECFPRLWGWYCLVVLIVFAYAFHVLRVGFGVV